MTTRSSLSMSTRRQLRQVRRQQRTQPAELKEVGAIGMEDPLGAESGELTKQPQPLKKRLRRPRQCSVRTGPIC